MLIILLLAYPAYKGAREVFWVDHYTYTIDNGLKIKLRIDKGLMGFQDFEEDKTIIITNIKTNATKKVSFTSLETNLYFFITTVNSRKILSVIDPFAGQNDYDCLTLELLNKKDCFKEFCGCGGLQDSSLFKQEQPYLIYDSKGFHKLR